MTHQEKDRLIATLQDYIELLHENAKRDSDEKWREIAGLEATIRTLKSETRTPGEAPPMAKENIRDLMAKIKKANDKPTD